MEETNETYRVEIDYQVTEKFLVTTKQPWAFSRLAQHAEETVRKRLVETDRQLDDTVEVTVLRMDLAIVEDLDEGEELPVVQEN